MKIFSYLNFNRFRYLKISGLYLAFTLLITGTYSPSILFNDLYTLSGNYVPLFSWKDSTFFIWAYEWWPYAILHGINPFISNYLFYPDQTNLIRIPSIPSLALLMAPFTILFGPVFSYNLVILVTPTLSGLTTILLAEKIGLQRSWAIIAGSIFAFSPYLFGHLPLHTNLYFLPLIPLGAYIFIRWLNGEISDRRFLLLSTLIITFEAGVSLEILTYCAIAATILFGLYYKSIDAKKTFIIFLKLGGLCTITLSPFIYYFFFYNHTGTLVPAFSAQGANLEFVLASSAIELLHAGSFVSAHFFAGNPEDTLFVGPILLLTIIMGARYIPYRILATIIIFGLISLGSPLFYGKTNTGILNPFGIVHYLPLMDHAYIERFSLLFWLVIAIALPMIASKGSKFVKLLVVLSIITIIPNPRFGEWVGLRQNITNSLYSPVIPSAFFNHSFLGEIKGKSYIVLPYWGLGGLWQAVSGMRFRAFGVYDGNNTQPPGPNTNLIGPLANHGVGKANLAWAQRLTAYCHRTKTDGILFDPNPWAPMAILPVLRESGWHETTRGRLIILTPPLE